MIKSLVILMIIFTFLVAAGLLLSEESDIPPRPDFQSPAPSPAAPAADLPFPSPPLSNVSPAPSSPTPVPVIPKQEVSGGFTRYIPDHNGDMEWKLAGTAVKFLSPTCLEIMDMKADSLSPEIGYLTISVGKVLYDTESRNAQADEERITVRRENMVLTGSGFLWSPDLKQIRVYEDVKVLIKEKGNIGLFPL